MSYEYENEELQELNDERLDALAGHGDQKVADLALKVAANIYLTASLHGEEVTYTLLDGLGVFRFSWLTEEQLPVLNRVFTTLEEAGSLVLTAKSKTSWHVTPVSV